MFPYGQYPLQGIALTGSIFMTVAISFERYVAVHNPINYNRAMNDTKVRTRQYTHWLRWKVQQDISNFCAFFFYKIRLFDCCKKYLDNLFSAFPH